MRGGDGEGKAISSPFEVRKMSKTPLRRSVSTGFVAIVV